MPGPTRRRRATTPTPGRSPARGPSCSAWEPRTRARPPGRRPCSSLVPGAPPNQPPTCTENFSDELEDFLSTGPDSFVVTEGETIVAHFLGTDPDGDLLMLHVSGLPSGATLTPPSGTSPVNATF